MLFSPYSHSALSPLPPPPSRTYQFLCELQRFLSDAFPQKKASSSPNGHVFPLATLSSLPHLTLGESSSESLLLGLLNSTTPTLFSFPWRGTGLLGHRVALSLQPPMLAMLRQGLVDALAQFRSEEVGAGRLTDRLQRLRELSALPAEDVDQSGGEKTFLFAFTAIRIIYTCRPGNPNMEQIFSYKGNFEMLIFSRTNVQETNCIILVVLFHPNMTKPDLLPT